MNAPIPALHINHSQYAHHRLLTDSDGRRFAKRDKDLTIRALRDAGKTPDDVFALIAAFPSKA